MIGVSLVVSCVRAVAGGRSSRGRCLLGRQEPGEKSELSEAVGGCGKPW